MFSIIVALLCVGLGVVLVFIVGAVVGVIEFKAHDLKKHENLYYDMLSQEKIDEYFEFRGKILPIACVVAGFLAFVFIYMFSDVSFFVVLLRVALACVVLYLGYRFYLKDFSPFRNRPEPAQTIVKKDSAKGVGTLFDAVQPTQEVGKPLISYVYDQDAEQPIWEALRVTNEDRGIILGAPGSGKTTYLVTQIIDWMQSGQSFVATDIKPEIWAILKYNGIFEQFGYKDWVFNPTDVNSDHYNIFSEVQDSSEFNEVLNIIIADTDSADAKVFNDNARRLLKAILIELGAKASLPNAQRFINSMDDNAELLKTLRQSDNETVSSIAKDITRTAKSDNLLASIMTAVSKAFDFLDDDRIRKTISDNAEGFYLKDVLMKPKQAVFLQFDQQYKSSTATLFGAMVAHTMRILQANQNRGAVFLALDEIINCAPIPKFTDLLNTIRSANMPTFLYLQSLEGLNRLYGLNADKLFLGSSNYKVVFKIGDIATAKEFSDLIGKTETTYFSYSENSSEGVSNSDQGGSRTHNNSSGYSQSTKLEYIIEPEELIKLPEHSAVVTYNGTFGTLIMPKYWEFFKCPTRVTTAGVTQWMQYQNDGVTGVRND
ncbi:type IV secretion system DNA-binding domain-containing protein [Acinetobacter gerneri]|uniref:type IV secretory system conjugative DNA transfer family protein n=1 Tax=Acinetobacter gerneri TaxID=202952 RepID=UPI002936ACAC|nr:type IV secretion system DNA-binding domain-containing protein [Acinetobacter gerneri]MDV2441910.1 type IV secretion system DNA-binding domain-containing protein [Acinetobacter gerneri]